MRLALGASFSERPISAGLEETLVVSASAPWSIVVSRGACNRTVGADEHLANAPDRPDHGSAEAVSPAPPRIAVLLRPDRDR